MAVLCARALNAELGFDELIAAFPDGEPDDEYLAIVYEDLVDGVEHLPGSLLSGKPDLVAWRSSEMYVALSLHLLLMGGSEALHELPRLYRYVRGHDPISVETLPRLVTEAREMNRRASP